MPESNTHILTATRTTTIADVPAMALSDVFDGQFSLFAEPQAHEKVATLHEALTWLEHRWRFKMVGGLDVFPYTPGFDKLYDEFALDFGRILPALVEATGATSRKNALWLGMLRLRKTGRLRSAAKRLPTEALHHAPQEVNVALRYIGLPTSRPEREQLPYTSKFDELFNRFNSECRQRNCLTRHNEHGFWRMVVTIMKAGRVQPMSTPLFERN